MNINTEEVDSILKVGISLKNEGVSNWGLTKTQSLRALDQFLQLRIAVLGGDVYKKINERIKPNDDNWYYEIQNHETKSEYVFNSIEKARNYIHSYRSKNNEEVYFVLVPQID